MKKFLFAPLLLFSLHSSAQVFTKSNINLINFIDPSTSTSSTPVGNRYSGCWGWYQQSKNKEYAISGSSDGTFFIDITAPATPTVCAFVQGRAGCTWREIKSYQNYCYIISDDASPNKFQIVDMQYLPDSVHVVHSGALYFERGHTLWIDHDKMYVGGITFASNLGSAPMAIFSLATPTAPALLKKLQDDIPLTYFDYVHDMYVRNDTVYASTGNNGLHILKFDAANDTIFEIGSYKGYPNAGYNHSSALTQNGKYLMFCDEVPASLPIHFVDVQNFGNIQPLQTFHPYPNTTPHNPYILGNNFAIVSCYQDGLQIYDISQPTNISVAGFFDTFPQGGANTGNYGAGAYQGNWGAYPFLPSKIIIASDMQNGVFLLDATAAFTTSIKSPINPVGIKPITNEESNFMFFPNPASNQLSFHYTTNNATRVQIKNMMGQLVYTKEFQGLVAEYIDVRELSPGTYIISLEENGKTKNKKLIVNH